MTPLFTAPRIAVLAIKPPVAQVAQVATMGGMARQEPDPPRGPASVAMETADPRIVADLDETHGQALLGFVRGQGLTDSQADDAVQEVLLRLWSELRRGVVIDNPKSWAYRAIYRLAMDEHRLRRRLAGLRGLLGSPIRTPEVHDLADRIAVWSEVDRLPERQRHVIYLRYRSDLSFEEIGEVLGITTSASRSHATQAMATLRDRLRPKDGG